MTHPSVPPAAVRPRPAASRARPSGRPGARVSLLGTVAAIAMAAALSGCATIHQDASPAIPAALYDDAAFAPPSVPVDPASVMALDDAMRDYAARYRGVLSNTATDAQDRLFEDLFTKGRLRLDYESSGTRTASEAFAARRGNCLSLVLLTAALANELEMKVAFQSVDTDEMWSRAGDLYFLNGHVNIVIGHRSPGPSVRTTAETRKVVDFLPVEDQGGRRTHEITEKRVLSMYMNNRAAESLSEARVDDAYWFAREAIRQDPTFLSAYNTLGVVYLRHHDPARAERVLRSVQALQPDNARLLGNLARALRDQGRVDEAVVLEARVEKLEPYPAFFFFVKGQLAMAHGDWLLARQNFQRELDREPDYHEFHFWMAQADLRLGDIAEARRHLALAAETSTRRGDHDLYAAKLDRLQAASKQ